MVHNVLKGAVKLGYQQKHKIADIAEQLVRYYTKIASHLEKLGVMPTASFMRHIRGTCWLQGTLLGNEEGSDGDFRKNIHRNLMFTQ